MTKEETVAVFNEKYPIGTAVCYWPIKDADGILWREAGKRTHTRSEAYVCTSGYVVVFLKNIVGYVLVDHLEFELVCLHDQNYDNKFNHTWPKMTNEAEVRELHLELESIYDTLGEEKRVREIMQRLIELEDEETMDALKERNGNG